MRDAIDELAGSHQPEVLMLVNESRWFSMPETRRIGKVIVTPRLLENWIEEHLRLAHVRLLNIFRLGKNIELVLADADELPQVDDGFIPTVELEHRRRGNLTDLISVKISDDGDGNEKRVTPGYGGWR